ncbi:MAG: PhnD/SsuA/transferrin family substrate-binding protein [Gammaproteobacteria bacterium]|nr:PhnD/SsuA/transferrin family substrate-binding protein [Gammaproteobacteria bacterium]
MKTKLLAILTCAIGLASSPITSLAKQHLSFGVYTSNKPTAMVKKFRPMLNALEKDLGNHLGEKVKIRIQVAKDYTQGINHLATGKIDFSRFGPASYVEAKRTNPYLRILALESTGGEKVFYGIICVAKDSPITDLKQLTGKSFAFGDEMSTIGRYLSQKYLVSHGIHSSNLSRFAYLDRHDKVGTAVGAGQFDAGALNEGTFKKLVKKGVPIRELARFPNVQKPWIARSGLSDKVYKAIQASLLGMKDERALKSLKKDGFVAGGDEDFASIRDAIDNNAIFFMRNTPKEEIAAEIVTPDVSEEDPAQAAVLPGAGVNAQTEVQPPSWPTRGKLDTVSVKPEVPAASGSEFEVVGSLKSDYFTPLDPDPSVLEFYQAPRLLQVEMEAAETDSADKLSASLPGSSLTTK